jgi:hypothetical protein
MAIDRDMEPRRRRRESAPASSSGSISRGDLRGKLTMLEIACRRCDRRGRLRIDRLIAEHGERAGLPDLRVLLAADCPHIRSAEITNCCGVHFPQLPGLFAAPPRR